MLYMLKRCTNRPYQCIAHTYSLRIRPHVLFFFFFFNDTATTEIYTLSLHDALPIFRIGDPREQLGHARDIGLGADDRSEEHTSELQSPCNLVCRLLLEKKKNVKSCQLYILICHYAVTAVLRISYRLC